jgi:hypothetical protein
VISARAVAAAWNRFVHAPAPVLPVCVYRIALGLTLLADAALFGPYVTTLFGPRGIVSLATAHRLEMGNGLDLLAFLPQTDESTLAFFALYVIAVLLFTVGLFTRASAALVWLGIVSLHHRNPSIVNGCDDFLRIVPFFMIFAPAGERLSVDAWLRRRRGVAPRAFGSPWAQRMMQIQLSILYVVTVLLKIQGEEWVDGTALYYISRLPEFARFPVPYLPEHLWAIRAATWGTLVVEAALGILVWVKECRRPVLALGLCLHLGIEYSMNLPLMQWVNIGALILFLKASELERAGAFVRERLARLGGEGRIRREQSSA